MSIPSFKPTREAYLEALTELYQLRKKPISSYQEMQPYFPHLSQKQIELLLKTNRLAKHLDTSDKTMYFATPAVLIKNSYHVLSLTPIKEENQFTLSYSTHRRTPESYLSKEYIVGDVFTPEDPLPQYAKEAIDYAQNEWQDSLQKIDKHSKYFGSIEIQDPKNLTSLGHPKLKTRVYWKSNSQIAYKDEKVRDLYATCNSIEGGELHSAGRGSYAFYCTHCFTALALDRCNTCQIPFKDNFFRSAESGTLTQQVIKTIQASQSKAEKKDLSFQRPSNKEGSQKKPVKI